MEIIFVNPLYLWFLIGIPILIVVHLLSLKYVKGRALEFANFRAMERAVGKQAMPKNTLSLLMRVIALSCLILAVSGPILWYKGISSDFDYVLAIDISSSMLATDYFPNRLEAAKEAASLFIDNAPKKSNIGVVSFAGTSFVDQPLSNDILKVEESLKSIQIKPIGGTDIGEAVITSVNLLMTSEKAKTVILLTDGRSTVGIPLSEAIDYANKNHAIVYTIGMGTKEGGIIFNETNIILKVDEETLIMIANNTGGKYYPAVNKSQLLNSYKDLASLSKKNLSLNLTIFLMFVALIASFIDWTLINTKYRRII